MIRLVLRILSWIGLIILGEWLIVAGTADALSPLVEVLASVR